MIEDNYSLFQKWILLQTFNQPTPQQTSQILLHCCDTALSDDMLEGDNVDAQIRKLVDNNMLISENNSIRITNQGILYTRIKLLRPIALLTDRPDFGDFTTRLPDGELKDILVEEQNQHRENKINLIEKLRNFGVNNMSKYVTFLNQVIDLSKQFPDM